jgi:hypothetical protein
MAHERQPVLGGRASRRHTVPWLRLVRPIIVVFGLSLLIPLFGLHPPPASAASSCTGWTSKYVPPDTIRVLRSSTGRVDKVDFRTYVAVVMGSGEWPATLPTELLEAGAQATKQFAWYHSLEGKHRSWYYTSSGACYDVTDTTTDQLYRPGSATVRAAHWAAMDATWPQSVRKDGKFILTQYRYGRDVPCASDVDGWKLFERSAKECAKQGWSSSRILKTYYGPNATLEWPDGPTPEAATTSSTPTVSTPRAGFETGATLPGAPALIRWSAVSGASSIARYQVQRQVGASTTWNGVSLAADLDTTVAQSLKWGTAYRYRVRAFDDGGTAGAWARGPSVTPRLKDDRNSKIVWRGTWQRSADSSAARDTISFSSTAGATAKMSFTGRGIALLGATGPQQGKVRVYVNGNLKATVDLYADDAQTQVVFFARDWKAVNTRTIKLEVVGTSDRPRVDLDAILVMR